MATINLGKVKGEPFRYEDFTPEQLEALRGKDFKYEDFSLEQLEGLKSKLEIGTVETLDADQKATVTSSVNGNITTLNIGIPRGNGVNSYSGTREEYEDVAETIKDGSLVNITDENDFDDENLIGQVTMQRLNDIEDNFDNIKPHALTNPTNNLLATEAGTALDAVQGKVLNNFIRTIIYTDTIASDLNAVTSLLCETNGSTLNTPYKEGVTTVQQLCVLTTNQQESYSTQFAFAVGYHAIYCRTKVNGTWGGWKYGMEMGGADYSPIPKSVQITSDAGTISAGCAYKVGHQLFVSAQVKITNEVKAWDTSIIKISGATFDTYNISYQQIVGYFYNSSDGSYDNMWSGQWEARTASLKSAKNLSAGNDYVRVSFVTLCD